MSYFSIFTYKTLFGCNDKFCCKESILEPETAPANQSWEWLLIKQAHLFTCESGNAKSE